MKDHNICSQYYKDLESGVEMLFRFDTQRGWMVSFQTPNFIDLPLGYKVSYPPTPEKYKEQIDKFYKDLDEKYQVWREE